MLDRGGAEGVAGRQHHAEPVFLESLRQLADGRRLAGAIDADHQDHEGFAGFVHGQELLARFDQLEQFGLHGGQDLPGFADGLAADAGAQVPDDLQGRLDADIRGDQRGFDLVQQILVDAGTPRQQGAQPLAQLPARVFQALFQRIDAGLLRGPQLDVLHGARFLLVLAENAQHVLAFLGERWRDSVVLGPKLQGSRKQWWAEDLDDSSGALCYWYGAAHAIDQDHGGLPTVAHRAKLEVLSVRQVTHGIGSPGTVAEEIVIASNPAVVPFTPGGVCAYGLLHYAGSPAPL